MRLQKEHWNYLVDSLAYLQQMAELNQRLLQVAARQGKLQLIGGYVHGRDSKDHPFILLYSSSKYLDHKICRVYRERFKTLPDYINTNVPPSAPDDNPTKTSASKQGIYKTCRYFTIATVEGKDTKMGKEVRYLTTVYVGKPPDPKGGVFRADLIQNRSLQGPAPEWPQEEYDLRHEEKAEKKPVNLEAPVLEIRKATDVLQPHSDKEILEQHNLKTEDIQTEADLSTDQRQELADEEDRNNAEAPTTYLAELNKDTEPEPMPQGVTLSETREIQKLQQVSDEPVSDGPSEEKADKIVVYPTLTAAEAAKDSTLVDPEADEPFKQTPIQKSTTEFIQANMGNLPPAIRQELLNQQLFPQHKLDPKPERPYKYGNGELLSDSPFVNSLYDVFYEVHNRYPVTPKALQLWLVSEDMKKWLLEAHNVEWISQEHDDNILQEQQAKEEQKDEEKTQEKENQTDEEKTQQPN